MSERKEVETVYVVRRARKGVVGASAASHYAAVGDAKRWGKISPEDGKAIAAHCAAALPNIPAPYGAFTFDTVQA